MKRPRKFVIVITILIVVVLFIGVGLKNKATATKAPTEVRIEKPILGELVEIVSAPGQIEPKTNVEISAKISARIVELPFQEGDHVFKGDPNANPPVPASVLVRLDAKDLASRLRSARANREAQNAQIEVERVRLTSQREDLAGLEVQLAQADRDLQRQQMLLQTQDISQSTFDQAKLKYDELKSRVESQKHTLRASGLNLQVLQYRLDAADAEIAQAEEALSNTVIVSPIDGIVTRLNAEIGELVMTGTMNNAGTVIMEVADLSHMLVVAEVDEADIGKVEVGQKAVVRVQAFWNEQFKGVLDKVALTFDRASNGAKYFRTEIILLGDVGKLYCGLTADVDILTHKHENVLTVPSQAVLSCKVDDLPLEIRQDNPDVDMKKTDALVVYRFVDGKVVVTPVSIGPSDMTQVIVESGIKADDQVIVGPYKVLEKIKHDDAVKDESESLKEKQDKDANTPAVS